MITGFPDPYPDELLWSVCARFTSHLRFGSLKGVTRELFGSANVIAVIDLPGNLTRLASALPVCCACNADILIDRLTLLPLYSPFVSGDKVLEVRRSMARDRATTVHTRLGIMAGRVRPPKWLRCCPQCWEEDATRWGERYWRRTHQVAGVEVCPIHHLPLEDTDVRRDCRIGRHAFIPAQRASMPKTPRRIVASDQERRSLLRLAEGAYWLLNCNRLHPGPAKLRKHYIGLLQAKGLATDKSRVRWQELMIRFEKRYTSSFLWMLQCLIAPSQSGWLHRLLRAPRGSQAPLRHLLFLDFVDLGVAQAFAEIGSAQNRGRSVPQAPRDIAVVSTAVPADGIQWRALPQLWRKRRISLREIGRRMDADPMTVKRRAVSMGLVFPRMAARPTRVLPPSKRKVDPNKALVQRRAQWTEARASHPSRGIAALRALCPGLYMQLYRHDRCWLRANQPRPCRSIDRRVVRADWAARDRELSSRLPAAARRIRGLTRRPIRISTCSIGRELGALAILQKHLDKLPRVRAELAGIVESRVDYACRRIAQVRGECVRMGIRPKRWQIIRRSGLREDMLNHPSVLRAIEAPLWVQMEFDFRRCEMERRAELV